MTTDIMAFLIGIYFLTLDKIEFNKFTDQIRSSAVKTYKIDKATNSKYTYADAN